jgi:hypothetical protein
MTDKDALLAQFFEGHEPPAQDARFVSSTLAKAQRKRHASAVALWAGAGSVIAAVLALVGPQLGSVFMALGPAAAPIAMVGTVLLMTRRMVWARA